MIILHHELNLKPENYYATANLELVFDMRGTYYFRIIPETLKPEIIKETADLGHEICCHYEDMDFVHAAALYKHIVLASERFQKNLNILRKFVPINTICMHGSFQGKYDNKLIWTRHSYRDLSLIGEPYFDIDFNEFIYLTDTGRRWNWDKDRVRDSVDFVASNLSLTNCCSS